MAQPTGVLLMSFGTAGSIEAVPAYLTRIRGGNAAPEDLVAEFQRRFRVTGGSPLIRITADQATALEAVLNGGVLPARYRVAIGMRHSAPIIQSALEFLLKEGVTRVVGVILAPQHSPLMMAGYHKALADAQAALGQGLRVAVAGPWHLEPRFLDALAQRVREALGRIPERARSVPILFTAHSVPKVIVDREPQYINMLKVTAHEVAKRATLEAGQWQFAYQSAGHTPEEWLRPDIRELFPALRQAGHRRVLVAPVQFLADHMEVLYDIDVAAREQAQQVGIELIRIEMLNTLPLFIEAMAEVVRSEVVALEKTLVL